MELPPLGAGRRLLVEGGEIRNMRLAALTAILPILSPYTAAFSPEYRGEGVEQGGPARTFSVARDDAIGLPIRVPP